MDWKKAGQNIAELETSVDCSLFFVNGISVWPLIRFYAYFDLVRGSFPAPPKKVPGSSALRLLKGQKESSKDAIQNAEPLNGGSVFFTRPEEFSHVIGGQLFNPYLDAVADIAQSVDRITRIEIDVGQNPPGLSGRRFYPCRYFSSCGFIRTHISGIERALEIEGGTAVSTSLERLFGKEFDYFPYENMLREFCGYVEFYRLLLTRLKPNFVFSVSVGDLRSAGLFAAAKSLGVKSIEVQHGLIRGLGEARYQKWPSYPSGGFDVLPDFFWTHDACSASVIENWGIPQHCAVVGGQPYFDWVTKKRDLLGNRFSDIKSKMGTNTTVVLVSLQSGKISRTIIDVMRELRDGALFLIRLHPVFTRIREKNNWNPSDEEARVEDERQAFLSSVLEGPVTEAFLDSEGVRGFDVVAASTIPLPFLLEVADVHVTQHSNTAIEAAAFGVPTYFSEKAALEGFEVFQAANLFDAFSSAEELIRKIRELESTGGFEKVPEFPGQIVKDEQAAERALREIYSRSGPVLC